MNTDPVPPDDTPTQPGHSPASDTTRTPPRKPYPFLSPPQAPEELGRLDGYRVLRLLGAGGMGYVFEAEDVALHRRVAIKVLRPDATDDPANRERFLREARAAAALHSDHVATIYQVGDGPVPYLAMQFLEGESLQSRIEKQPPLTLRTALEITRQAALGLAHAHARGLTHRDIKPANLWLEARPEAGPPKAEPTAEADRGWTGGNPEDELSLESSLGLPLASSDFGRVKILDFGLARRSRGETSLTSTGFIVGTPNFMAPEQAAGGVVDGRADLFSLGCVLYTMLVGEPPFQGPSAMAVMMALANKTPPPVNTVNPTIPQSVADLVSRLLEKEPDRRVQSARELVTAIGALLLSITGSLRLPISSATNVPVPHGGETPAPSRSETMPPSPTPLPQPGDRHPPTGTVLARLRRSRVVSFLLGAALVAAIGFGMWARLRGPAEPITVGVLHSRSGTMAVSEGPVAEATLLAVNEINAAGGVLGRQIRVVEADGKSDADEFARQAERLLGENKVTAIFGCWTSASRKSVREVLERRDDGLLFYPVQYEGIEQSPRVVYLGPAPNQQLIPAIDFLTRPVEAGGLGKKRLFLVGSDYVFPRVAHQIIRDQVKLREKDGVRVVGEKFFPLGSDDVGSIATELRREADVVVNTINGGTNLHFFAALRRQKVTPAEVPVLSVSLTEHEVMGLDPAASAGDYLAASYFQNVDRAESREFLRRFRDRYGPTRVVNDPMAAAYTAVHLWANAVRKAGTTEPMAVREALKGMEYDGVRTRVRIDPENLHAWLPARIGRVRPNGFVDLVAGAGSEEPIRPVPYPPTRDPQAWEQVLLDLQLRWDGKWQAPDKK